MKKTSAVSFILVILFTLPAFASKGYANDGLVFILWIALILFVTAALLKGTDYIIRNRRKILPTARQLGRKAADWSRRHFAPGLWRYLNSPT